MMKIASLTLLLGMAVSTQSMAAAYKCDLAQPMPGSQTFLILVQDTSPGVTPQGVILVQQMNAGNPAFKLIDGNATVNRAPDGGPLVVSSKPSPVDWTATSEKDQCFSINPVYHFSLSERTTGVTGAVAVGTSIQTNPNKTPNQCPEIAMPAHEIARSLVCTNF